MTTDAEPTINPDVLAELRLLGEPDGDQFLCELIDEFVADATGRLSLLGHAVAGDDAAAVAGLAHSLKGSSGQLGFARLAGACSSLERIGLTGSLAGAGASLEQVDLRLQELRRALVDAGPPISSKTR